MEEVKFLDLRASYPQIKAEILEKIHTTIEDAQFIEQKYVKDFEQMFAQYCGVKHCIAVNNGTSALMLSLMAHNIGIGDEVIIPVNTFIATAEAVSLVGAKPVFVDVHPQTYLIDVEKIKEAVTIKTKALIPVHLYGQCADMDAVLKVAREHNLVVIEDACQAHGALYKNRRAGSLGDIAAFSFYPGKNLGAWGEAGAITTHDDSIAQCIRELKSHGEVKKYHHNRIGGNFRMEEFQAAVLGVKLRYLDTWNALRRDHAKTYMRALADTRVQLPRTAPENVPVWHLFVVQVEKRDQLKERLHMLGIQTGIHYPYPLHLTNAYRHEGCSSGSYPNAESIQSRILSLPMYPELSTKEIEYVAMTLSTLV